MKILESAENYLERILMLSKTLGKVRAIDIVHDMNFSKPSVSVAMKNLKENNYITIDEKGYIYLTAKGLEIANKTLEKHELITSILMTLGVEEKIAKEDACKIEHDISEETHQALIKLKDILNHK